MSTMVPMYGFGGGGGKGAALTVTAPAGCTVTVSKDGKTKTKTAGTDGVAVFKGLATGEWTVTITDGEQTAQKTVTITADYSAAITFFSATVHVTYPAGSTCTATDGVTTLTAPDTSGTWDCVVPNAAVWTVSCTDGSKTLSKNVSITEDGQSESVNISFEGYIYKSGTQFYPLTKYGDSASYVTFNTDNIFFNGSAGGIPQVYTEDIDISQYKSLSITASFAKGPTESAMAFGIRKNIGSDLSQGVAARTRIGTSSDLAKFTLDISGFSGSYKVFVGAYRGDSTVTEIWLE